MAERQITMNELINVTINEEQQQVVSARDLHKGLEVTTRFSAWVKSNFEMFDEGIDYIGRKSLTPYNLAYPDKLQEIQDYELTINMAKELSMMSHTDKGKEYRNYFLKLEDMVKNQNTLQVTNDSYMIQDPVERAKRWIEEQQEKQELEQQVQLQAPKVEMAEKLLEADDANISMKDFAKLLANYGVDVGRNTLMKGLRNSGWLLRDNTPSAKAMARGIFNTHETVINTSFGTRIQTVTTITPKGQEFLIKRVTRAIDVA